MKRKARYKSGTSGLMDGWSVMLHIFRIITALLFTFSGFVKAVDPLGTVYKIQDYLSAFGGFFESVSFIAFPAAFLLILVELLIGIGLFLQFKFKLVSWLAFAFMLVVTPLTLYIALKNPVTDCGCFGDAVKLTNWQTFGKNIPLLLMTLLLIIFHKSFKNIYLPVIEWIMAGFFAVAGIAFMIFNLLHLPVVDFRPFRVGVNIPNAMTVPADAPKDVYDYIFTYEKEGVKKNFALNELPDSTWSFVSQESKLITKGAEPEIKSFVVLSGAYEDVTDDLLSAPGKTYIFVMHDLSKASEPGVQKIKTFISNLNDSTSRKVVITGSSNELIMDFERINQLKIPYYTADDITLKTMIRANPGIILLEKGTIKGKWNWRDTSKIK